MELHPGTESNPTFSCLTSFVSFVLLERGLSMAFGGGGIKPMKRLFFVIAW